MPKDYIQIVLDLQEFFVLGLKEHKSEIIAGIMRVSSYGFVINVVRAPIRFMSIIIG